MSYFTEMLVLSLSEVSGKPEPEQPGALPDILLRNNYLRESTRQMPGFHSLKFMIRKLLW